MSENGYFSLPRSLTRDPLWIDLPPSYRDVFISILDHVCFKPQKFDDHGTIIDLKPGQVCTSLREIVSWCGKWACKNEIERAIKKFILYGFARQEVRHKKSIITITHKDTYELILRSSETRSETILRQTLDKLETEKKNDNNEKKENTHIADLAVVNSDKVFSIDFNEEKEQRGLSAQHNIYNHTIKSDCIETKQELNHKNTNKVKTKKSKKPNPDLVKRRPNIETSDEQHKKLIEGHGEDLVNAAYDHLAEWKTSKLATDPKVVNAHTDYYRITQWVFKAVEKEISEKKATQNQSLENVIETNKKKAQHIAKLWKSTNFHISINEAYMAFGGIGSYKNVYDIVPFKDQYFDQMVDHNLLKKDFKHISEGIIQI